jgi:hypothetical protein
MWSYRYSIDDIKLLRPFLSDVDAAELRVEVRRRGEKQRQQDLLDTPRNMAPYGRKKSENGELVARKRKPGPGRAGKDSKRRLTPEELAQNQVEARRIWREKNWQRELERQHQRRQERRQQPLDGTVAGQMRDSDT